MSNNNFEHYDEDSSKKVVAYRRAEKRLKQVKGFYRHLFAYIIFTPFTIFINYVTYWDYKWFWYSLVAWGIGLAFHAFAVFVPHGVFGSQWEQRKIEQYLREEEERKT